MRDTLELLKVSAIGAGGFFATLQLADVATLVSIGVGLCTIAYVSAKTFFLIRNRGREERRERN
jgi:hypothetical protein